MKYNNQHILNTCIAVLLLIAVVLPTAVKFAHIFEDHKHEVCTNLTDTHYHEVEIDCEIYKFKLSTVFSFETYASELIVIDNNHSITGSQYQFVSEFQRLPFSLRGPPSLI